MRNRRIISGWEKYLPILGLGLFGIILYKIDFRLLVSTLKRIDYKILAVLPIVLFLFFTMQTVRLNLILRKCKIKLPFWQLFRIQLIGVFYATITPGKVGSMLRIGYIAESANCPISQGSTAVVMEKFLDLLSLCLLALGGAIMVVSRYNLVIYQILSIIVLMVAAALFFHKRENTRRIGHFFYRYFLIDEHYKDRIKGAFNSFYDYIPRKREATIPFILSILSWIILYSGSYLIALAMGIKAPYSLFILLFPITAIVGILPITVAGLGTREITLLALFKNIISPVEIVSISILSMVFCGVFPALIGFLFSLSGQRVNVKSKDKRSLC